VSTYVEKTDSGHKVTIISNYHRVPIIDAWELSEEERKEFDYVDWNLIARGEDSASFVRYKGELYDLGDFMRVPEGMFHWWDGYISDSFFSGILIKHVPEDNFETVIVGRYYA
jgi:hypothetical protein